MNAPSPLTPPRPESDPRLAPDPRAALLDELVRFAPAPDASGRLQAPRSRRAIVLDAAPDGAERVRIVAPGGEVELTVILTADGPVLRATGLALELDAAQALRLRCASLDIEVAGDVTQTVGGDQRVEVAGVSVHEAHAARIVARAGNVELKANDDVRVDGERIWLNR